MFWCPNSGDACEHKIVPKPKSAFLIMPFSYPEENKIEIDKIEKIIKDCFEEIDFSARTARDVRQSGNLLCKICENIQSVAVGVVIYTENTPKNSLPNIFYEAAIMHVYGKEVILVGYNIKIPSDLNGLEWILPKDLNGLREEMRKRLKKLPEKQSYFLTLGEFGEDAKNYEEALEYYMRAALISPEKSIQNLKNLYNTIKDRPEYRNITKRVDFFIRLLQ